MHAEPLRTLTVTRYVTPLREGGSLPAIVAADDDQQYVVKFRGAGQGPKVLVAELICGRIAQALDLPLPEPVFMQLGQPIASGEPDPEIQALLQASLGLNLALAYVPQAFSFDPVVPTATVLARASDIVWLDAFITNVDRTARNTNMLVRGERFWLIDHGASLYFHYAWNGWQNRVRSRFVPIRDHVLLPYAEDLAAADARLSARLSAGLFEQIVAEIPDTWLDDGYFSDPASNRAAYVAYLSERLLAPRDFAEEAHDARRKLI